MKKLLLLSLTFACLLACNEKSPLAPGPDPIDAPKITYFGVVASDTIIATGSQIVFEPQTTSDQGNVHQWYLDSKEIATESPYTFKATQPGRYKLKYRVSNVNGQDSRELSITVKQYVGGFYIVNEGWFGHQTGSVNHFDPKTNTLTTNVYQANNEGLELGVTTCYAALWNDKYYYVSKQNRRLVVADALSLKDQGSLDIVGGDGRAFVGVDDNRAVITTNKGAYRLSLNPLVLGEVIEQTKDDQCGGVFATKEHLFVINQNKGIQIFSINDNYRLLKTHAKGSVGFALSVDGSLWAADGGFLVRINTKTLDIENVELPSGVSINNSWGAWNPGPLVASKVDNVLYFTKSGMWGGGHEIYRYQIGNSESLLTVFASSSAPDDKFYGGGIAVDPANGDIVATFVRDDFGDAFSDNRLVIFDSKTGQEKLRKTFINFWFPSMILFNE